MDLIDHGTDVPFPADQPANQTANGRIAVNDVELMLYQRVQLPESSQLPMYRVTAKVNLMDNYAPFFSISFVPARFYSPSSPRYGKYAPVRAASML